MTVTRDQTKVLRYLNEAHERERAAVPELRAQIKAAPLGEYRDALERQLAETRRHIGLLAERLTALGYRNGRLSGVVSLMQAGVARANARLLTPLDLLRPHDADDRIMQRARHVFAAQASNIAIYRALERHAQAAGDPDTEALAVRLGEQEQETFDRVIAEVPALADALSGRPAGAAARDPSENGTPARPAEDGATQLAQPGESIDPG